MKIGAKISEIMNNKFYNDELNFERGEKSNDNNTGNVPHYEI